MCQLILPDSKIIFGSRLLVQTTIHESQISVNQIERIIHFESNGVAGLRKVVALF